MALSVLPAIKMVSSYVVGQMLLHVQGEIDYITRGEVKQGFGCVGLGIRPAVR